MEINLKYNQGAEVFYIFDNKVRHSSVIRFKIDCRYIGGTHRGWGSESFPIAIRYCVDRLDNIDIWLNEEELFHTKQGLLDSL